MKGILSKILVLNINIFVLLCILYFLFSNNIFASDELEYFENKINSEPVNHVDQNDYIAGLVSNFKAREDQSLEKKQGNEANTKIENKSQTSKQPISSTTNKSSQSKTNPNKTTNKTTNKVSLTPIVTLSPTPAIGESQDLDNTEAKKARDDDRKKILLVLLKQIESYRYFYNHIPEIYINKSFDTNIGIPSNKLYLYTRQINTSDALVVDISSTEYQFFRVEGCNEYSDKTHVQYIFDSDGLLYLCSEHDMSKIYIEP